MMPDRLSPERFAALAGSYGADIDRWPAADRAAAKAYLAGTPSALLRARALDQALDSYRVAAPSSALIGQILASAHHPREFWSRARLWWSGLGLAGVGLAGAMAGALAISIAVPAMVDRHVTVFADEQSTAFDNADVEGSDL